MWKRGRIVDVEYSGPADFVRATSAETLDPTRVFAVDTESMLRGGKLSTVLTTLRFHDSEIALEVTPGIGMLSGVFSAIWAKGYAVREEKPSWTKVRTKRGAKGKGRDGSRQKVPLVLSVWFNLSYDFGRLVTDGNNILRVVSAGANSYSFTTGEGKHLYSVEVRRMFFGSSSAFVWMVRHPSTKTICHLQGIDLTGYWKVALATAAKAVGVTDKIDIESDLGADVYRKSYEEFTPTEWESFKAYGLGDVRSTLELYHATVKLLCKIDPRVVRKNGVVPPSAPGASARILFAKAFDVHPHLESWERYPVWADQLGAVSYHGGRVFRRAKGVFRGMVIKDLKSAYPFQMTLLPDPVTVSVRRVRPCAFDFARFKGHYGVLVISGEALDDEYPAFRIHDPSLHGRLRYVFGKFDKIAVTIPEILIGVARGALRVDRVWDGAVMVGKCETSFLKRGVEDFFAIKEDKRNEKALQDLAKLLANSSYGKVIEVQEQEYLIVDAMACPRFVAREGVCKSIAWAYANGSVEPAGDSGFYWGQDETKSGEVAATAKDCFERLCSGNDARKSSRKKDEGISVSAKAVIAYVYALEAHGEEARGSCSVGQYLSEVRTYKAGAYFMPLYGSQITGATSAMVGAMSQAFGAQQGDTDSVHLFAMTEAEERERWNAYQRIMTEAGYPSPEKKGALGSWADECKTPSVESVLARTKLYSHKFVSEDGEVSYKQAHHGLPKFFTPEVEAAREGRAFSVIEGRTTFDGGTDRDGKAKTTKLVRQTLLHLAIRDLCVRGQYSYTTRPAPRRMGEAARSGKEVGEFISREMNATIVEDPNTWVDSKGVTRWVAMGDETRLAAE